MKSGIDIGDAFTHQYKIPPSKTVRHLFKEATEFADFPEVFATGFMVALMEWTCVKALSPFLEAGEGSVGTRICVGHNAATPPGFTVSVNVKLAAISKKRLTWNVIAFDGLDKIGSGTHERAIVELSTFNLRVMQKLQMRSSASGSY